MCFHKRKTPACIIMIMSIIMALGGVALLIESIVFEKRNSLVTTDLGVYTPEIANFRKATFIAILLASLVAILLGILGSLCLCKFCKKHSCCLSVGYGTTLFFVWIVFIIVGAILTAFAFLRPEQVQQLCTVGAGDSKVAFIGDVIQSADKSVGSVVNSKMCSQYCVCPTAAANDWLNKPESYLNEFGRTLKTSAQMNSTDIAKNLTSLVTSKNGTVYTKFTDCASAVNETSQNGAMKLIKYFEEKYTCSGIC